MLKTFYKLLLCIGIGMAVQQEVDASTSKVRLAASFGVQAIKAATSAAKAHPFLSLAAAATTTAVVAVQREHSKYRRRANALEEQNKKRATESHLKAVKDAKDAANRAEQVTFMQFARKNHIIHDAPLLVAGV